MTKGGLHKRGKTWHAVWHEDGKQRWKSTGKTSKKEAQEWLADRLAPLAAANKAKALRDAADAAERQAACETGRRIRITEVWDEFANSPERSDAGPETMRNYRYAWNHFLEHLKQRKDFDRLTLVDITHTIASDYARALAREIGHTTYNGRIAFMRTVWRAIGKRTGSTDNPWISIARRRSPPVPRRELTAEEVVRIYDAAEGEWKILVLLGIHTGMRLSDCALLKWSEVDLGAPGGATIRKTAKKTARSSGKILSIPVHAELLDKLIEVWPNHGTYVMPTIAKRYAGHANGLAGHIARLFDKAKIDRLSDSVQHDRVRRSVVAGFHSLRHTFVTLCRRQDAPLAAVEAMVGHSNSAMTRHYTHVGDATVRRAIDSLPSILGAQPKPVAAPVAQPLPAWAVPELRAMDAGNWSETRDRLLAASAAPCAPAQFAPAEPEHHAERQTDSAGQP